MTEYIMSKTLYTTHFVSTAGHCFGDNITYDFKIDTNGNIFVKQGMAHYTDPTPIPKNLLFSIIDDIKIPEYIIKLFDYLSNGMIKNNRNMSCRDSQAQTLFGVVKHLKQSIKEMAQNPQNITEIQTQIELYVNKNTMLELDLETMNNKIKNIQTAYFDAINDNEKNKEQNKLLNEKIAKLENEIKQGKIVYVDVPKLITTPESEYNYSIYRVPINSINTGTLPNAANRMVYNKYTGIYEPEDD